MLIHSLEDANRLMPYLQCITQEAAESVLLLAQERDTFETHQPEYGDCVEKIQQVIDRWVDRVDEAGAKPRGLWTVDFDKGDGYYTWNYPEPSLEYCRQDDCDSGSGKRQLIEPEIFH